MFLKKPKVDFCYHDYKNAIEIGKVDHICPKCKQMLDPFEWFLMVNYSVVDVSPKSIKRELRNQDRETSKKIISKYKFENKDSKLLK